MSNRDIWLLLSIFALIILSLFGVHFIYLYNNYHTDLEYLYALIILFPASLVVGYIFISQMVDNSNRQKEKMEHIIKEVLHEINLPISTIEANCTMIKQSCDNPKIKKRVERIEKSSIRLKKLYSELAYNIKKDIMPIEREEFNLKDIINESIQFFKEMKRNEIILDIEDTFIYSDKIGFMQLLDNLIENAIKYSDSSTPIIIKLQNGILSIEDNGIGMDENEILKVYERYYQSDRKSVGEGIGLAIVKRFCDDEGISLKIESQKGKGTKVIMDISKIII